MHTGMSDLWFSRKYPKQFVNAGKRDEVTFSLQKDRYI